MPAEDPEEIRPGDTGIKCGRHHGGGMTHLVPVPKNAEG